MKLILIGNWSQNMLQVHEYGRTSHEQKPIPLLHLGFLKRTYITRFNCAWNFKVSFNSYQMSSLSEEIIYYYAHGPTKLSPYER